SNSAGELHGCDAVVLGNIGFGGHRYPPLSGGWLGCTAGGELNPIMRQVNYERTARLLSPLDVAAETGVLVWVDGLVGEEVVAGDGDFVAGATGVELASVDELEVVVEEEEVGRAGGVVGSGDLLGF